LDNVTWRGPFQHPSFCNSNWGKQWKIVLYLDAFSRNIWFKGNQKSQYDYLPAAARLSDGVADIIVYTQ